MSMDGTAWAALVWSSEAWLAVWSELSLKVCLLLALTFSVSLAQRRASAAARHMTWTLAVAAVVALPLARLVAPSWNVVAWPAPLTQPAGVVPDTDTAPEALAEPGAMVATPPRETTPRHAVAGRAADLAAPSVAPSRPALPLAVTLFLLWLAGLAILAFRYAHGALRLQSLVRRARLVAEGPWRELADAAADGLDVHHDRFRLYAAAEPTSPLAWGVLRVAIVLPPAFGDWSPERRRHVLLHELAHVKRRDCATQWLASVATTLHWFNPFVWVASRRMLAERERACDDQVLLVGTRASAYADDLLQIARVGGTAAPARVSAAMARRSQIADRLLAVLDPALRRGGVGRRTLAAAAGLTLALVAPLAALTAAQSESVDESVVEGRVVGPDGAPVEGAEVRLQPPLDRFGAASAARVETAETDASGAFRMTSEEPGPFLLRVRHPDFAPRTLEGVSGDEPVSVALAEGLTIEGRVRDANRGDPVAGARVRAESSFYGARNEGELGVTLSGAEGRFRLEHLPAGALIVSATAQGYARAERRDVSPGTDLELVLIPGSAIEGVVVDSDGRPVSGARVHAVEGVLRAMTTVLDAEAPTGDDGTFRVPGAEGGRYRIEVESAGFAPFLSDPVEVEAELPARVTLELEVGAAVVGRLVTAEGDPTPGQVELRESEGFPLEEARVAESRVDAGADGWFRLGPLASGEHLLIASAPHCTQTLVPVRVALGEREVELGDVRLEVGGWIRGRVVDEDGGPVAGAAVSGSASGPFALPTPSRARTGPDGSFELAGLGGNAYRLSAAAPGFVQPYPSGPAVATGTADALVEMVRAGAVTGVVEDLEGRPVTAFSVQLESEDQSSGRTFYGPARPFGDAEGIFRLDDVVPGNHVLEVTAAGLARAVVPGVTVTAGETSDVGRIRLDRGAALSGTVIDESGAPVPGAEVRLQPAVRGSYWAGQHTRSGIGGAYRIEGLEAGRVDVLVRHRDYADERVEGIEIVPGRSETSLDVVLVRGGRVEGRVRRRDGSPLPSVPVTFTSDRAGSMRMASPTENLVTTDADGRFAFSGVPPGRAGVHVFARSGSTLEGVTQASVEVRPGETATADIVLSEILVRGQVTRGGTPAPGVVLRAQNRRVQTIRVYTSGGGALPPTSPRRLMGSTDESGRYELLLDGPGAHEFMLLEPSGRGMLASREIDVPDAPVHVVDLELPAGVIAGRVLDAETRAPLAEALAEVRPSGEGGAGMARVATDPAGRFQLYAEPGRQRIAVSLAGYASVERDVTVREGTTAELEVALERGLELRGLVVDAAGNGVGGVGVVAVADPEERRLASRARTLGDGSFVLAGLEERSYSLATGASGLGFAIHPSAMAGSDEELVLQLRPAARLVLRVVDARGTPVEGANAHLEHLNGLWFAQGSGWADRSSAEGRAELLVPGGQLEIVATHPDGRTGALTLEVADGGTAEGELVLEEPPGTP